MFDAASAQAAAVNVKIEAVHIPEPSQQVLSTPKVANRCREAKRYDEYGDSLSDP